MTGVQVKIRFSEEIASYYRKYARIVWVSIPLLVAPVCLAFVVVQSTMSWQKNLLYAVLEAMVIPAMGFHVHTAMRAVLLAISPSSLLTLWPRIPFQVFVFACGGVFGSVCFYGLIASLGDLEMLSVARLPMSYFPVLLCSTASVFYFAARYYREVAQKARKVADAAEYSAFRSQMEPHFLFNSLNTLTELIETDRPEAVEMVQSLSELYRYILEVSKRGTCSVREEVYVVQKYLEIQKHRLGARLEFSIHIDDRALDCQIPGLLLQTLVENAIRHGVTPHPAGGEVHVEVRKVDKRFVFRVRNTGRPIAKDAPQGTGLQNSISRLALLYGTHQSFHVSPDGEGTLAEFTIEPETIDPTSKATAIHDEAFNY